MQQPGVQSGFPSPRPNTDIEAMRSAHSAAINSNEKIFPIFAKKLSSSDTKDFLSTAHKFAVWLSSEKAYYPAARLKIVELLEIALSTFVNTSVHHPDIAELAKHMQQLVHAIIPFGQLFPENELQSRLQRVILDINLALSRVPTGATPGNMLLQGSVTASIYTRNSTPTSIPSSALASVPNPQTSMWKNQPSSSVSGVVKAVPDGPVHADVYRARNPSEVASSDQVKTVPSLVSPTPQDPTENVSPVIPSKPQPKRARRAELSEELIARDLDWFKSNQGTVMNDDPSASSSKASEDLSTRASDVPHIPGRSPSPKKKTARMVPSRRLPRRIPPDASQPGESSVSASAFPSGLSTEKIGSAENAGDGYIQMDVDQQRPPLERVDTDVRSAAIPEARDSQHDLQHEKLPSNRFAIGPERPQKEHQSPSVETPFLNCESPISTHSSATQPPGHETTIDKMESMDISSSDLGSDSRLSEPRSKRDSTPPQSPVMLQFQSPIFPQLVNALEPPVDLKFRIPKVPLDASQRRFNDEMTVVLSTQGKPFSHTHRIDFCLNEGIFAKISKWVNRKFHPSDAVRGVCISLACYRLLDIFDAIKVESGKHDIEELTSQSSCSWPCSSRLFLHVNTGERQTTITLSPPLFVTPEQCVDVSSLIKLGNNSLEIGQQGDLSDHLIVLHAHLPTRAQLAEFDAVKTADKRWKQFLDALSGPAVAGKVLGAAAACAVGVS